MPQRRSRRMAVAALVTTLLVGPGALTAAAQDGGESDEGRRSGPPIGGSALQPNGHLTASKAPTSIAQSDPALVARQDATRVPVLIKLDYDAIASYRGRADGAPATSPSATGQPLTPATTTSSPYARQVVQREAEIVDSIRTTVPSTSVGRRLRVVYGGVAATVPANRVDDLLEVEGVVAVQEDELRQPATDSSTEFISAPPVWSSLGGQELAGQGVLFGSLDSGVWPEHPSFAANPDLGPAPTQPGGDPIPCDFGDDPLTPATDVFECNNKLVGGQPFIDTYNEVEGGEVYPDSARDSSGHGTHTASTAAGGMVASTPVFGVDRGPASGVAPGAFVSVYKVCGVLGCFSSDSVAAVEAALLDGVDVINFSIGGGTNPFTDPVELAFLDAYEAGVFVATSAGNEGPGPSTAGHLSPWVTTVAASTQTREFASTLTLTSSDGPDLSLDGASITPGVDTPLPVVWAGDAPYSDAICAEPADPGLFDGVIVACERGSDIGRVEKGFNVAQGGAEGMILYNPTLQDTETDNHFLPTVHLADGTELLAYLDESSDVEATFTDGTARAGQGDVIAGFSSRGPGGFGIKPDVTAPGVQILAGHTPTPDDIAGGPAGEYYQAIAGTSMSSPHVAGSAILLHDLHPDWTPGQVKSALMTTATTDVVKEDLETPADPFDMGSGRIIVSSAAAPGLTIADDAAHFFEVADSPTDAIHANIPSINAPVMPGRVSTTRVVENVGSGSAVYDVTTSAPPGTAITVVPDRFTIEEGATRTLTITITADDAEGQQFGSISLTAPGRAPMHLPVAFVPTQGGVSLASDCSPDDIELGTQPATCTVTATNESFDDAPVSIDSTVDAHLDITDTSGTLDGDTASLDTVLAGREPGVPSLEEWGELGEGYIPLDIPEIGAEPIAVGDEDIVTFDSPPFVYNGVTYTEFGATSDGYLVVGPATAQDVDFIPQDLPDPARPNNVLAPYWGDLIGTGVEEDDPDGILAALVSFGPGVEYVVVEFRLNAWGTDDLHVFQVWLGINGTQDISFNYDPENHSLDGMTLGEEGGLTVGAENEPGTGGDQIDADPLEDLLPEVDLAVVSTDPAPGDEATLELDVVGTAAGTGVVTSEMESPIVPGTTIVTSEIDVIPPTSDVEAFVVKAWVDFLGHNPTQRQLDIWTTRIQGGTPRGQLLGGLRDSPEFRRNTAANIYDTLLGRELTPTERSIWTSALAHGGLTEAYLWAGIGGSAEYRMLAGGTTTAFVDQIYQDILDRDPSADRRAYWVARINAGTPRSELALYLYQHKESRDRRVRAIYTKLLDRLPSAERLAARSKTLLTQPDGHVMVSVANTSEYYQLAQ